MFTLIFIVALNGVPEKTLLLDGFVTRADCEKALEVVIEEMPRDQIYALACAIPVGKVLLNSPDAAAPAPSADG